MEYPDTPPDMVHMVLGHLTDKLNRLELELSSLRSRLDEADQLTSQEYADQVVEQIKASLPAIQKAAMAGRKARR